MTSGLTRQKARGDMDAEALFFGSLLTYGNSANIRLIDPEHLTDQWKPVYAFIVEFTKQHGKLPRADTVEGECSRPIPASEEHPEYYADKVRENALRLAMDIQLTSKVAEPLQKADTKLAHAGLQSAVAELRKQFPLKQEGLVLDNLSVTVEQRLAAYHLRQKLRDMGGLPLPWEAMTRATGGLQAGDLWVILSRPNVGKTWVAVVIAMFLVQGGLSGAGMDCLFASMETPPFTPKPKNPNHRVVGNRCIRCFDECAKSTDKCPAASIPKQRLSMRFDAVGARVSAWRFVKGLLTPREYDRFTAYLKWLENSQCQYGRLKIVASPHIRSIADIEMECIEMQPDVVIVDSGYLAATDGVKRVDNKDYGRMVIDLKHMLDRLGIPGVLTWHFNRDVGPDALFASANNAALTDEIARVADVIIGLFRTPELETAGEAIFRSLKVREGLPLRELRTFFRVKEEMNFAEIAEAVAGQGAD